MNVIVSITEAHPEATKLFARELRVGDRVFDVYGGTHALTHVRHYVHVTRTRRDDGPADTWDQDDILTVLR